MSSGQPSPQEQPALLDDAAKFGITLPAAWVKKAQREQDRDFIVFPDAWESVVWFQRFSTQWNISYAGATGLNYPAVLAVLTMYDPESSQQQDVFDDIQDLERGALQAFADQRDLAAKDKPAHFDRAAIDERKQRRC